MPTSTFTHPLFGLVRFKTKTEDKWVRGDPITFLSGFDSSQVRSVVVPQLKAFTDKRDGKIQFHKRAHGQLVTVFSDLEKLGLMKYVKTCAGSYNPRLKKPISKTGAHDIISQEPSNHAFGIAIDLNSDDGSNGGSVAPLAPVFEALGFKWGISFNDPMHFEVARFIDSPRSVVAEVPVTVNGQPSQLFALNLAGDLVADAATAEQSLGLTAHLEHEGFLTLRSVSGNPSIPYRLLGERRIVSLAQLSAVAGMSIAYDQSHRTAALTTLA